MSGTTAGTLLGGRVLYEQPEHGYRTGIEPVLLAASVPARGGERVLEAGSGAGAGLLCLSSRVGGVSGLGLERDPAMTALAVANAAANGFTGLTFVTGDIGDCAVPGGFDHGYANPPWHAARATPSPVEGRRAAKQALTALDVWAAGLANRIRRGGTVTLAIPASQAVAGVEALERAGAGRCAIFPLWPRSGADARIVLLQAISGTAGPLRISSGLTLHRDGNAFSEEADYVFRGLAAVVI